jgi:thiol-disulfide isomerase/thioredoxin
MHTRRLRGTWIPSVLTLLLAGHLADRLSAAGIKTGDVFPDLASFTLEGRLPDTIKGKVVLVDFWASWCAPCKASFPALDELHRRYQDRGFVVIAVSVDDNRARMEDFLKNHKVGFSVLRDARQKLVENVGVGAMPSSFLLDREGKVRFAHTGYRGAETKKKYEEEIELLLK